MGEDPAAIREEIEHTREHMGATVDALGYKADVPARAKESVSGKVEALKMRLTGAGAQVADATPDAGDVKQAGRQAAGVVQENPVGLAIGAAAAGFLAGMLLPHTTVEDERLGPPSDQLKEQVRQTGQDALEHGRQIAQETAETATEKAREAVGEVKDNAQTGSQEPAEDQRDGPGAGQQVERQPTYADGPGVTG